MRKNTEFPNDGQIREMNRIASKARGAMMLPPKASHLDKLKFSLCKKLVIYVRENELTQAQLAKKLRITKTRMNEVLNYRFKRISLDFLVEVLDRLNIQTKLVA